MREPVVIFPDNTSKVAAACRAAVPSGTAGAKRPATLAPDATFVQYRNDSGPIQGVLRTERWGVNIWAPTMKQAIDAGRTVLAEVKKSLPDGRPITAVPGGTGPFEVVDNADPFDKHAHVYVTFELTVRGTSY